MPIAGQMQLIQPMLRPTMSIGPHAIIGGNLIRSHGGLQGMPGGKLT